MARNRKNRNRRYTRRIKKPNYKARDTLRLSSSPLDMLRSIAPRKNLQIYKRKKRRFVVAPQIAKTKASLKNPLLVHKIAQKPLNKLKKVCQRRHQRNEIIHVYNKSGRSGQKKPNNKTRNIKC